MRTEIAGRRFLSILALAFTSIAIAGAASADELGGSARYVADFVSTAAFGVAMNDAREVAGSSYRDPGCGPFCLPPLDTVVWRGGDRIVLPDVPGLAGITVRGINAQGRVAGFAGFIGGAPHATVWEPAGDGYSVIDLGALPGHTISEAVGIDDLGRVVGWSTTTGFPPNGSPFLWTKQGGLVDLAAEGFPDEPPLAISPGGTVATQSFWYRLGDPASVVEMPPAPSGFGIGAEPTAINDAGDQARFLISTGGQRFRYLFRFHHEGVWQQLSLAGGRHGARGVGSINAARDVTATNFGTGVIAYGPDGLAQPLLSLFSPAYQSLGVTFGGPMNDAGEILAQVMIGRSQRLMRLVPAEPCNAGCLVSGLQIRARFVEDPGDPGHCTPDGKAYNEAAVRLVIRSEGGSRVAGVMVRGRFLDDYWTNAAVSGRTDKDGVVMFGHRGPCGVGAIAFLVDRAVKEPRIFDRTVGTVASSTVPQ